MESIFFSILIFLAVTSEESPSWSGLRGLFEIFRLIFARGADRDCDLVAILSLCSASFKMALKLI